MPAKFKPSERDYPRDSRGRMLQTVSKVKVEAPLFEER